MIKNMAVPTIDLSSLSAGSPSADVPAEIVESVATAAEHYGFFQIINHGIDERLIEQVWAKTKAFFAQPIEQKRRLLRTKDNSRGYYDRELTKNARDLKEVLDLAHVPFPELSDSDERNHHEVDGPNQWPDLDGFRPAMLEYLAACETLSLQLLAAFCLGLGEAPDHLHQYFGVHGGVESHTSFIRLNHYPLSDLLSENEADNVTPLGDMALHHHSDAGALTLLLQDDIGGLQVSVDDTWIDVEPIPGALVVNTGDMMQVWSNDRYQAALHRVAPRVSAERFSLPYFFNPSYSTTYHPLDGAVAYGEAPHYRPINWGHFRQARADGDFADYGAEVQIIDFRTGP